MTRKWAKDIMLHAQVYDVSPSRQHQQTEVVRIFGSQYEDENDATVCQRPCLKAASSHRVAKFAQTRVLRYRILESKEKIRYSQNEERKAEVWGW